MTGQNPIQASATSMQRFPLRFALPLFAATCLGSFAYAEEFVLEKPGRPESTLLVRQAPDALQVIANPHTPHQREYVYDRFRPGDTDAHIAYYGRESRSYLRWPLNLRMPVLRLINGGDWHPLPHRIRVSLPPAPAPPPKKITETFPLPPLPKVTVELFNRHHYDLMVTVVDRRDPTIRQRPRRIPAGGMILQQIDRDPGHLERTSLVSHTGETIRVLSETEVAPEPLYDVMVYEHTPVSQYFDRTGTDRLIPLAFRPPSITFGERSLGAFPIPAGPILGNGAMIDVFAEASARSNPGLASRL